MEPVLNSAMCRCCASEGTFKDIHTRYHWMGDEEVYSVMLKECFDITLSSPQGDEGGICEVCITQLRNAFNFKKQVLHTEEQFQHLLPNKVQEIKMEYTKDSSEEPEDRPVSAADNSDSDFTPSIKEEDDEALESKSKTKKRAVKSTAARSKKPKLEAPETSTQSTHRVLLPSSLLDKEKLPASGASIKIVRAQSSKQLCAKASTREKRENTSARESSRLKKETKRTATTKPSKSPSRVKAMGTIEKVRNNTLQILKYTNATPIRSHNGVKYGCCFCKDAYVDPKELKLHTIERHEHDEKSEFVNDKGLADYMVKLDITSLQCNLCKSECETMELMFEHLLKAHDIVVHTDINCQMLPFKFTGEKLSCFICKLFCNSFKTLQYHMFTHYGHFCCDVCGKSYTTARQLYHHQKSHKVGTFKCDKCEKVYDTAVGRKVHIYRVHTSMRRKLYKCGYCGERFNKHIQKVKHLVAQHNVPRKVFKCHACDKMFQTGSHLSRHTRKFHLMERNHKCSDCGKKFFLLNELKSHMITHEGYAKFKCDPCLKCFKSEKSLKNHMKLHLEDHRFKCDQCDMTFEIHDSWECHMKNEHGHNVPAVAK